MTEIVNSLVNYDQDLFLWLNSRHEPWMDNIMFWVTYKVTWLPMYVAMVMITARATGMRAIAIVITVIVAVVLADQITSGIMKPYFSRFRPCHEPLLAGLVHEVGGCGGSFGFASSHASTSFALAITWFTLLRDKIRYMWILILWACLYSYSRVYVGVHYPGDILVGACVGLLSGACCIQLYRIFIKKYYLN